MTIDQVINSNHQQTLELLLFVQCIQYIFIILGMGCSNSKSNDNNKRLNGLKTTNNSQKKKQQIKAVFLGDAGVGKSSIANKYFNDQFKDVYQVTIGGVYFRKDITLKNSNQLALHLWDTGGQQRYRAMAPLYYRDASIAILVYDVSDQKSFQSLDYWIKQLQQKKQKQGMIVVAVGNKCDIPTRVVPRQITQKWAKSKYLDYFQTSAKTGYGIKQLFQKIAQDYAKKKGI